MSHLPLLGRAVSRAFVVTFVLVAMEGNAKAIIACKAGEFPDADSGACGKCATVANCTAGTVTCTTASDSECGVCAANHYKQDGLPSVCAACAAPCTTGSYEMAACTQVQDRVCAPCDSSCAACSGPGSTSCTACPAGRHLSGGQCVTDDAPDAGEPLPDAGSSLPDASSSLPDASEPEIDAGGHVPDASRSSPSAPAFDGGFPDFGPSTSDEDCSMHGAGAANTSSLWPWLLVAAATITRSRRRRT